MRNLLLALISCSFASVSTGCGPGSSLPVCSEGMSITYQGGNWVCSNIPDLPSCERDQVILFDGTTWVCSDLALLPNCQQDQIIVFDGMEWVCYTPDFNVGSGVLEGSLVIFNSADVAAAQGWTEITGDLIIGSQGVTPTSPGLTSLILPNLERIGGRFYFDLGSYYLQAIEMPKLKSVGSILLAVGGGNGTLSLVTIDGFNALESIEDDLRIYSNQILATLQFPNLRRVGGDFSIFNNPLLPTCAAEQLRDQVQAREGIGGAIRIEGNNDLGTCQ